jgi:hypothetical protein
MGGGPAQAVGLGVHKYGASRCVMEGWTARVWSRARNPHTPWSTMSEDRVVPPELALFF